MDIIISFLRYVKSIFFDSFKELFKHYKVIILSKLKIIIKGEKL